MKKKILLPILCGLAVLGVTSCASNNDSSKPNNNSTSTIKPSEGSSTKPSEGSSVSSSTSTSSTTTTTTEQNQDTELLQYQGAQGYLPDDFMDFTEYENTESYRKVSNAHELLDALNSARYTYTNEITEVLGEGYVVRNNVGNETNWARATQKGLYVKNPDGTYTKLAADEPFSTYVAGTLYYEDSPYLDCNYSQTLTQKGVVNVIEITDDINLGWNKITDEDKTAYSSIIKNFTKASSEAQYTMSSMFIENGISQVAIERTNNLLIYSKNGAKLTHAGFKINFSKNIAVRNIEMDEIWQWEDSSNPSAAKVGDMDAFGWAYFKIGYSENIWIDHCTFGKSYDGQIDVSNPYYSSVGTNFCAPYEGSGKSNVHISWCNFTAGSDDKDGYLYKMMEEIEVDYQSGGKNYLYYNALRDANITFDQILYGIAIPQKKAFLLNDSGTEFKYNKNLEVSFANCYIKNIEDRLPKLRSGSVYMYNVLVDNFEYYNYRKELKALNVATIVSKVNSSWKCALVSQGIVCGNGGNVYANSCIFRGIEQLLKNNDSELKNECNDPESTKNGGYLIEDSIYQLVEGSNKVTNILKFPNASTTTLRPQNFKWRTEDGEKPFEDLMVSTDVLEDTLLNGKYRVGVIDNLDFLTSVYSK